MDAQDEHELARGALPRARAGRWGDDATMSEPAAGSRGVDLNFASVYWTHEELFGRRITELEVIELLQQLAVEDCVEALSRLSCLVETSIPASPDRQVLIINRMGFAAAFAEQLSARVTNTEDGPRRTLFFSQQVTHLMRLALMHCDDRPGDHFEDNRRSDIFVRALFGVTDLFRGELSTPGVDPQIQFMIRQLGLMARPDTLSVFSRYYDLLLRLWPKVVDPTEFDPASVFHQHTELTMERYFTIGFGVYSRFLNYSVSDIEPDDFALVPNTYFETTALKETDWRAFLKLLTAKPAGLRQALEREEAKYGQTLYRSSTFDRCPLVELSHGRIIPTSFVALERAVTEGVFWILANATEAQQRPREDFTGPFGRVFERFVQESMERIAAKEPDPPTVFRDFSYGPRKHRVMSSDVTLVYPHEALFCEVVTGRPIISTITRGDLKSFWNDVDKLVAKKARQLSRCLRDFLIFGTLKFDGVGNERLQRVWPVLIMVEEFPLMPPIREEIDKRLRKRENWPRNVPRLTVMDADELGALETLVEQGWTMHEVIRQWKADAPELPLANWLAIRYQQQPGHSTWHLQTYRQLTELVAQTIFGRDLADIEAEQGVIFGVLPDEN